MQVSHFVNDYRGGLARYVERLVAFQKKALPQAQIGVFGPQQLSLPAGVSHSIYQPIERKWGANQWKFAFQSPWVNTPGIRHFHNYAWGEIDVLTCHGLYTHNWLSKHQGSRAKLHQKVQFSALSALERHCLTSAKVVVFQSIENEEFVVDYFKLKRPSGAFVRVPQAVDPEVFRLLDLESRAKLRRESFPQLPSKARWLLFVGHDFHGKGLLRILEEMGQRREWLADTALLVFGNDPHHQTLAEKTVERERLPVFFLKSELLKSAYSCSDFLLLNSISEGAPMVLLEAMAAGCVPIFTPCGGVRETIQSGQNGWIAESPSHLVELALKTSSDERERMSRAAVATARKRDFVTFEKNYRDVYESIQRKTLPVYVSAQK